MDRAVGGSARNILIAAAAHPRRYARIVKRMIRLVVLATSALATGGEIKSEFFNRARVVLRVVAADGRTSACDKYECWDELKVVRTMKNESQGTFEPGDSVKVAVPKMMPAPPKKEFTAYLLSETQSSQERGWSLVQDASEIGWNDTTRSCLAKGGTIRRVGMRGNLMCVKTYRDAGKQCTDSSQCLGGCYLAHVTPSPGKKAKGVCRRDDSPYGCFIEIHNGEAQQGGICAD